jgi:DHA2 family multidrug resistance protein-like MFS transporter
VAVLGSIVSSTYGPQVRDAVAGAPLPATAVNAISDQIGAAMEAAQRLGGAPGRALATAASNAFIDGMSTALMVGAGALALGAVVVALFLPARGRSVEGEAADADATVGDDTLAAEGDADRDLVVTTS